MDVTAHSLLTELAEAIPPANISNNPRTALIASLEREELGGNRHYRELSDRYQEMSERAMKNSDQCLFLLGEIRDLRSQLASAQSLLQASGGQAASFMPPQAQSLVPSPILPSLPLPSLPLSPLILDPIESDTLPPLPSYFVRRAKRTGLPPLNTSVTPAAPFPNSVCWNWPRGYQEKVDMGVLGPKGNEGKPPPEKILRDENGICLPEADLNIAKRYINDAKKSLIASISDKPNLPESITLDYVRTTHQAEYDLCVDSLERRVPCLSLCNSMAWKAEKCLRWAWGTVKLGKPGKKPKASNTAAKNNKKIDSKKIDSAEIDSAEIDSTEIDSAEIDDKRVDSEHIDGEEIDLSGIIDSDEGEPDAAQDTDAADKTQAPPPPLVNVVPATPQPAPPQLAKKVPQVFILYRLY